MLRQQEKDVGAARKMRIAAGSRGGCATSATGGTDDGALHSARSNGSGLSAPTASDGKGGNRGRKRQNMDAGTVAPVAAFTILGQASGRVN